MDVKPLQLTNVTPAQVIPNAVGAGVIPVGNYKGAAAFWDLDKAVNQPLAAAEKLHILGNIDGAGVNGLATMTVPLAAVAGQVFSGTITVPANEVWFINAVLGACVADATATVVYNWRCSLFADVGGNVLGGVYRTAWAATPVAPPVTGQDEFSEIAVAFTILNKPVMLRLPALTTITGQLALTAASIAATGVVGTFRLFGYKGKVLVA